MPNREESNERQENFRSVDGIAGNSRHHHANREYILHNPNCPVQRCSECRDPSTDKPPRPIVRGGGMAKYIAKYMVVKPTISADRSFVMGQVQVQPRVTTAAVVRPASSVHPQTVLEFSSKVVKLDSAIPPQLNPPNGVRPASSVQRESLPVRPPEAAKIGAVNGEYVTTYYHFGSNPATFQMNPANGEAYHDMYFKGSGTNPFIDTEDDHLSTFAMDVDTGSYSITRRYLTDGYLPPPEAVRVEEFVNTFDYNYTPPTDNAFAIHVDGAPSRFGEGKRLQLLRIGLQGRVMPAAHRKDAILTFVIDVSGSMQKENRLGLVKKALTLLVDQLRPTDKVGIVVYGSRGRLVLPHTGIEQRSEILAAINSLAPVDQPTPRKVCESDMILLGEMQASITSTGNPLFRWGCQCR